MERIDYRCTTENGPQRFVELAAKIPMVSDRVLVERLKELEKKE